MKKLISFILLAGTVGLVNAQLKMNSSGNIGIGMEPGSYKLDISGPVRIYSGNFRINHTYNDIIMGNGGYYGAAIYPESTNSCNVGLSNKAFKYIYAYNYPSPSDERQKENIRDIQNALNIVLGMRGVLYDLKKEYAYTDDMIKNPEDEERLEEDRKNIYGFLAQELEKNAPEVVIYNDSTDIYAINYMQIIPLLAEAIKELNETITALETRIEETEEKSAEEPDIPDNSQAMLGRNRPNPFTENTTIEYFLPSTVQKAVFYIYDLQGKQIKSMTVKEREQGILTIPGNELQPGMYHYTLIADGIVIGTEKMILTD